MRDASPARVLLTAAVYWPLVSPAMAQETGNAAERPSFQPFRYDEDWRALEDRSTHSALARCAEVHFTRAGRDGSSRSAVRFASDSNSWITLASAVAPQTVTDSSSSDTCCLQISTSAPGCGFSANFRADLQTAERVVLALRIWTGSTSHQAFLDWKVFSTDTNMMTIRMGRQEIGFGSGRLLSPAEGLNVRRSMDGARITVKLGKVFWNMTALRLVKPSQDIFNDFPDHTQTMWGTGFAAPHPIWKRANISLYYFGLDRKNSVFEKGAGRTIRHTIGSRSWKKAGGWDFNYEAIVQWGSFQGRPIRAWALSEDTGYTLSHHRFQPRIGIRADVASGDGGPRPPYAWFV